MATVSSAVDTDLVEWLLDRPDLGIGDTTDVRPTFGGILLEESVVLLPKLQALPPDEDGPLKDLTRIFSRAVRRNTDLVTVYL